MNSFKTTQYALIILSFVMLFFFCTDPVNPNKPKKPNISNNGTLQTFGKLDIDSTFGMFVKLQEQNLLPVTR